MSLVLPGAFHPESTLAKPAHPSHRTLVYIMKDSPIIQFLDFVDVSIDGLKRVHDSLRSNSFDKAIDGLDYAITHGRNLDVNVNITLSTQNKGYIKETINYLSTMPVHIFISPYYRISHNDNWELTAEEHVAAIKDLFDVCKTIQNMNVVRGERRSQRRRHVLDAVAMQGQQIEIALDNVDSPGLPAFVPRTVQPIKRPAFVVEQCLGGIQILW